MARISLHQNWPDTLSSHDHMMFLGPHYLDLAETTRDCGDNFFVTCTVMLTAYAAQTELDNSPSKACTSPSEDPILFWSHHAPRCPTCYIA